jgi:hypothetical protein
MSIKVRFKTRLFVRDTCLGLQAQRAARALARHFNELRGPIGLTNRQFWLRMALNRQTKPQAGYPVSAHVSPEAAGPESIYSGPSS